MPIWNYWQLTQTQILRTFNVILYANTFIASSLRFSQPFMLLISRPKHLLMLEKTDSTTLLMWYSPIHSSILRLKWYLPCRVALAVTFALKSSASDSPLSWTLCPGSRSTPKRSVVGLTKEFLVKIPRLHYWRFFSFEMEPIYPKCFYSQNVSSHIRR